MSHFAKINEDNVVVEVIVAEQDFIDSGVLGDPNQWLQTSYNTRGGVHILGGTPFRKNYAGIGMLYDPTLDAFIYRQPYNSWTLDVNKGIWQPPIPVPDEEDAYVWNEGTLNWVKI